LQYIQKHLLIFFENFAAARLITVEYEIQATSPSAWWSAVSALRVRNSGLTLTVKFGKLGSKEDGPLSAALNFSREKVWTLALQKLDFVYVLSPSVLFPGKVQCGECSISRLKGVERVVESDFSREKFLAKTGRFKL
jgi:hypothetical protein